MSDYFVCSWESFTSIELPCQAQCEGFCLVFFHLVCCDWLLSLGCLFFFEGKQMRVDLREREGGRELGGVAGRETIVRMHCMREESIFDNTGTILY